MPSIILPPDTETIIEIVLNGVTYKIEIFELESLFIEASDRAKEKGVDYWDTFPKVFKSRYEEATISPAQSRLLYLGMSSQIEQLKKRLFLEPSGSEEPESKSSPKQKRKKRSSTR